MSATKAPDHDGMARAEIATLEEKRMLVAAELEAIGAELGRTRGRGDLALAAVLGDGRADAEIGELDARATDMNWSTRYDVDGYLRWDPKREVWVGSDGFAYDGASLREYSRGGRVNGAA